MDDSFGAGGQVRTSLMQYNEIYAAALQPDGKIVVAGSTSDRDSDTLFGLVRYLPDGQLDTSFGEEGKVLTKAAPAETRSDLPRLAIPYFLTLQEDGSIVVGGLQEIGGEDYSTRLIILRYTPDGRLDTSFAKNGIFGLDTGLNSRAHDAVLLTDGKLVVAGEQADSALFLRLTPEGTLDPDFGTNGVVTFGASDAAKRIILTSEQRYLVATTNRIVRFNRDGTQDVSFENPSLNNTNGFDIGLQTDGKIIVGSSEEIFRNSSLAPQRSIPPQPDIVVRRFDEDGNLDTDFGSEGKAITKVNGAGFLKKLVVQADDKIIITGANALTLRLNENGTLEASSIGAFESAYGLMPTSENAILIAGYDESSNGRDYALAKFLPEAAPADKPR